MFLHARILVTNYRFFSKMSAYKKQVIKMADVSSFTMVIEFCICKALIKDFIQHFTSSVNRRIFFRTRFIQSCMCYKGVVALDICEFGASWVFFPPREGPVGRKVTGAKKSLEALFYAASDTLVSGA